MSKFTPAKSLLMTSLVVCAFVAATHKVDAQALGAASTFNVYVLGNDTANGTTQGSTAVAGNATFTDYTVDTSASPGSSSYGLVVGGALSGSSSAENASVWANNIAWSNPTIYGNVYGKTVALSGGGVVGGNVVYGSSYTNKSVGVDGTVKSGSLTVPVNFTSTSNALTGDSSTWGALAPTSPTVDYYNGITLTGTTGTNVFDITGAQLNSENNLIINSPLGSTVLVNISGTNDSWSGGLSLAGGITDANVIYNFYQATNLNLVNVGIDGTVLAPNATVNFEGGNVSGGLIAGNLVGNQTEFNGGSSGGDLFAGVLPNGSQISIVPEPSPMLALLFGATGLLLMAVSQRRSRGV